MMEPDSPAAAGKYESGFIDSAKPTAAILWDISGLILSGEPETLENSDTMSVHSMPVWQKPSGHIDKNNPSEIHDALKVNVAARECAVVIKAKESNVGRSDRNVQFELASIAESAQASQGEMYYVPLAKQLMVYNDFCRSLPDSPQLLLPMMDLSKVDDHHNVPLSVLIHLKAISTAVENAHPFFDPDFWMARNGKLGNKAPVAYMFEDIYDSACKQADIDKLLRLFANPAAGKEARSHDGATNQRLCQFFSIIDEKNKNEYGYRDHFIQYLSKLLPDSGSHLNDEKLRNVKQTLLKEYWCRKPDGFIALYYKLGLKMPEEPLLISTAKNRADAECLRKRFSCTVHPKILYQSSNIDTYAPNFLRRVLGRNNATPFEFFNYSVSLLDKSQSSSVTAALDDSVGDASIAAPKPEALLNNLQPMTNAGLRKVLLQFYMQVDKGVSAELERVCAEYAEEMMRKKPVNDDDQKTLVLTRIVQNLIHCDEHDDTKNIFKLMSDDFFRVVQETFIMPGHGADKAIAEKVARLLLLIVANNLFKFYSGTKINTSEYNSEKDAVLLRDITNDLLHSTVNSIDTRHNAHLKRYAFQQAFGQLADAFLNEFRAFESGNRKAAPISSSAKGPLEQLQQNASLAAASIISPRRTEVSRITLLNTQLLGDEDVPGDDSSKDVYRKEKISLPDRSNLADFLRKHITHSDYEPAANDHMLRVDVVEKYDTKQKIRQVSVVGLTLVTGCAHNDAAQSDVDTEIAQLTVYCMDDQAEIVKNNPRFFNNPIVTATQINDGPVDFHWHIKRRNKVYLAAEVTPHQLRKLTYEQQGNNAETKQVMILSNYNDCIHLMRTEQPGLTGVSEQYRAAEAMVAFMKQQGSAGGNMLNKAERFVSDVELFSEVPDLVIDGGNAAHGERAPLLPPPSANNGKLTTQQKLKGLTLFYHHGDDRLATAMYTDHSVSESKQALVKFMVGVLALAVWAIVAFTEKKKVFPNDDDAEILFFGDQTLADKLREYLIAELVFPAYYVLIIVFDRVVFPLIESFRQRNASFLPREFNRYDKEITAGDQRQGFYLARTALALQEMRKSFDDADPFKSLVNDLTNDMLILLEIANAPASKLPTEVTGLFTSAVSAGDRTTDNQDTIIKQAMDKAATERMRANERRMAAMPARNYSFVFGILLMGAMVTFVTYFLKHFLGVFEEVGDTTDMTPLTVNLVEMTGANGLTDLGLITAGMTAELARATYKAGLFGKAAREVRLRLSHPIEAGDDLDVEAGFRPNGR